MVARTLFTRPVWHGSVHIVDRYRYGDRVPELDGLVVLDMSTTLDGAYCAKLFADAGATVTLLEPAEGAALRRWSWQRELPPGETGALFRYLRHGQRSIVHAPEAQLAQADVVITSGPTPLGSAPELADANPGVIVVSLTPYGLTGPYADRPATEFTVQADSGALAIRGTADRPPIQMGGRIIEWVAGAYAAVAVLASCRRQAATGQGDLIDVSLSEVANLTGSNFSDLFNSLAGRPPLDRPARTVELPSIEPTADGWVGFNTNTREQFDSFCLLIERPDLLEGDWWRLQTRQAKAARMERAGAGVDHATHDRRDRRAGGAATHPGGPGLRRCGGARAGPRPGAGGLHRRPDGHVPDAAPALDDRRRARARPEARAGRRSARRGAGPAAPRSPGAARRHAALPLAGITVVDLTAWWAGPSATGILAALGADVIHVESARRVDGMRLAGGMFYERAQWWEYSAFFLSANANKRDVTLDLDTQRGRELVLRLVEQADLVVENFTPRVLESFDLDWDTIHATNPRAVLVRMPAFGLTGPWRDRPGFAQTMEQITGLAWMTGHPDDQPRIQRGPCDPNGGLHAAFGALVGLARRDRTGAGCLVEAPMFEAALAVAAEPVLEWTAYGYRVARDGNRSPAFAPQGLYACAGEEQWLAVSAATDEQWRALAT